LRLSTRRTSYATPTAKPTPPARPSSADSQGSGRCC
jgi:hypothetical protein